VLCVWTRGSVGRKLVSLPQCLCSSHRPHRCRRLCMCLWNAKQLFAHATRLFGFKVHAQCCWLCDAGMGWLRNAGMGFTWRLGERSRQVVLLGLFNGQGLGEEYEQRIRHLVATTTTASREGSGTVSAVSAGSSVDADVQVQVRVTPGVEYIKVRGKSPA